MPPYTLLALRYLEHALGSTRSMPCARSPRPVASSLRVDAHAEGDVIGVGAWLPHIDDHGRVRKELSPWLSVMLSPSNAAWAFRADGQNFRHIATLEAFAILLGVRFLVPVPAGADSAHSLTVVPALTDNQGNGRVLTKLFTTRHPWPPW